MPNNILTATENDDGQRVDNFLLRELNGAPKSLVYKLLRSGQVRVNGGRKKPTYRLSAGDLVRVPPKMLLDERERGEKVVSKALLERLQQAIAFEDDDYLVLNKPAGLAVHGGSGIQQDVLTALKQLKPDLNYLELGHRIDRQTSGALLLAKSRVALTAFHDALKAGDVTKRYLALASGVWKHKDGWQKHELQRLDDAGDDFGKTKQARSHFECVAEYSTEQLPPMTLLKVTLDTGRTHQIRMQTQKLGAPLLGDDKYGERDANRAAKKLGCKRMFLHAAELYVPLNGREDLDIKIPLANDLQAFLSKLDNTS